MPLKLRPGSAYVVPASTSFAARRPLSRHLLPVLRLNPPTCRIRTWDKVEIQAQVAPARRLAPGVPLIHKIHSLRGWPKVNKVGIIATDRDANAPTSREPVSAVEIPPDVAQRCRYRGEMMLIDGRPCAVFVDPDFVSRYAQVLP
jgi:hypothetical protein